MMVKVRGKGTKESERRPGDERAAPSSPTPDVLKPAFVDSYNLCPMGMAIFSLSDGIFIEVNNAFLEICGYSREEIIGHTSQELDLWVNREEHDELVNTLLQDGRADNREIGFRHNSGRNGFLLISAKRVVFDGNDCCLGSFIDISKRKQLEESFRNKERMYRSVVEDLTEVVCRFTSDDTITFVNEVYCRFFGKTREELVGGKWHPVAHPDDLPHIAARLKLLSPTKTVVTIENRVYDGNGELRWMQFVNRGFFDSVGNLVEIQSVGRDISEQKLTEEALRDSEERYRRLFETETDAILLVDQETMGFIDVNLAACYMYGYTLDEFRSLKVHDISVEPEKSVEAIISNRAIIPLSQHRKKNGSIFPVEISGSNFVNRGRRVHVAAIRDISERIRTEMALRSSEARYRVLFENSLDAIFLTIPDGRVRAANPAACELFGMTEKELIKAGRDGIMDQTDGRLAEALEQRSIKGSFFGELTFVRKDGTRFPAETSSVILDDCASSFVILRDISERKKTEIKLLEREKMINAMALELSFAEERERYQIAELLHDQVAPKLFLVKMKIHALLERLPEGDYDSVTETIDNLLDLGVEEIRSLTLQLRPPVLSEMGLEAALRWLGEEYRENYGLNVKLHDDRKSKPVKYEMGYAIFRIVRELLLNVTKHAGAKTALVSMKKENQDIIVSVEDDGVGFDTRVSSLNNPRKGGFGIYSARMKVEYMGGELKIDSSPGKGTKVTIRAPLHKVAE